MPRPGNGVSCGSSYPPVVSVLRLSGHLLHGLVNVATIYLPLLGEGTDCWRPVEATDLGSDLFRIVSERPEDEEWPYLPGEVVRCRWRQFSEGEGWEAIAVASAAV